MLFYENVSIYNNMADLLWKIRKIFTIMWVFEVVCVICAKSPFIYSLDVPIKMYTNSLVILNQQTVGMTNHVHCFQT